MCVRVHLCVREKNNFFGCEQIGLGNDDTFPQRPNFHKRKRMSDKRAL